MSKWKLYWVASDGLEDCFVVAKNSQSAKRIEKDTNGFEDDELTVTRVKDIPDKYEKIANKEFRDWSIENNCNTNLDINKLSAWPGYAKDWLLEKLGAEFRLIEGVRETLIDDIVYAPDKVYPIGLKAMKQVSEIGNNESMDISNVSYEGIENVIDDMLGKAIIMIHKIEDYITNSYIFAVGNDKYANYTINGLTKMWKDKFTFGRLIKLMEEQYEIDEAVRASLELFLIQRNKIAHGLTKDDRYDIDTFWGQKEIVGYLALFFRNAVVLEEAMQSAYIATLSFSYYLMEKEMGECPKELKKEINEFYSDPVVKKLLGLFVEIFHRKD